MAGPLTGVKLFDLTVGGVGPWAIMILASMGANVVRVESEERTVGRGLGDQATYQGLGTVYMHCQMGKKGVFLDLKTADGREEAYRLLREADVFAENMKWGTVDRLGMNYEEVSKINPRIVYGDYPGWGSSGPYKDFGSVDALAQAFSGPVSITGKKDGKPEFLRWYGLHDFNASSYIVTTTLLGLLYRERTGKGIRLMSPQQSATIAVQTSRTAEFLATGVNPPRLGSGVANTVPHRAFLCQDNRWLAVGVVQDHQWRGLCKALKANDLLEDQRLATNPGRVQHRDEVEDRLQKVFSTKAAQWWLIQLRKHRVPVSLFYDRVTAPEMPQVKANGFIVKSKYPKIGTLPFGNIPFQLSKTPVSLGTGIWPGQDTERVLKEGWGKDGAKPSKGYFGPKGAIQRGVLDGVTVIDTTQGLTGPYASLLLADAGARVIKVEPPEGDYTRHFTPLTEDGVSATFFHLNRNKEGVRLDVRKKEDRQKLLELLKTADIFIEEEGQLRMKRLGLSYQDLQKANPGLVYCTITAYGTKGPLRNQPTSELVLQAMSDFPNDLGEPGEEPVRMGPDMVSLGASLFATHGILGALYHKWRIGEGQHVDVSALGSIFHQRGITWLSTFNPDEWTGFYCEGNLKAPDYGYKAADKTVVLGGARDRDRLNAMLKALKLDSYLEHPVFQHPPRDIMGRTERTELFVQAKRLWEEGLKTWKAEDVVRILQKLGNTSGVVNNYQELFSHPQFEALDMVKEVKHPRMGNIKVVGPPWKLDGVPTASPQPYKES